MFATPTPELRALFKQLHDDRKPDGETLRRHPGIFNIIVEQYQDSAHFVYELLQNADDAQAEKARFTLTVEGLVYAHVGNPFTITPAGEVAEKAARRSGHLGDVNALCSLAGSNKVSQVEGVEQKMGKFGIGFKAVSLYTDTPHVYDRRFAFRLRQLIVPELIEEADKVSGQRASKETLFWLPFDRKPSGDEAPGRSVPTPAQSFEQIATKLRTLRYPLLFLRHLRRLEIEIQHPDGRREKLVYTCNPEKVVLPAATKLSRPCTVHLITLKQPNTAAPERWLVLSRDCTGQPGLDVRVAYAVGPDGHIIPAEYDKAFCYFSTARTTKLKFLVQAPWLLTASRENLKALPENEQHVRDLGQLAADSLLVLRDLRPRNPVAGTDASKDTSLLTDGILKILPLDGSGFGAEGDQAELSFRPIFTALQQALCTERLLPTKRGRHVTAREGWWAETPALNGALGKSQLCDLVGAEANWVFVTVSRFDTPNPQAYIQHIVGRQYLTADDLGRRLRDKPAFFEQPGQTDAWMASFYRYVAETPSLLVNGKPLRKAAFLRLADGGHAAPWDDDGELQVFLPRPHLTAGVATLKECFATDRKLVAFRELLRLSEPQLLDTVRRHILPRYGREVDGEQTWPTDEEHLNEWPSVVACWRESAAAAQKLLQEQLRELPVVLCIDSEGSPSWQTPVDAYLPSAELQEYFAAAPLTDFVDEELYSQLTDVSPDDLRAFWQAIGVEITPRVIKYEGACGIEPWENSRRTAVTRGHNVNDESCQYWQLPGALENLHAKAPVPLAVSQMLFDALCRGMAGDSAGSLLEYHYKYYYYTWRGPFAVSTIRTPLLRALETKPWLYDNDGQLQRINHLPEGATTEIFSLHYNLFQPGALDLLRALDIKEPENSALAGLTEKQREQLRRGALAEELSDEELRAAIIQKRRLTAAQADKEAAANPAPYTPQTATAPPLAPAPPRPAGPGATPPDAAAINEEYDQEVADAQQRHEAELKSLEQERTLRQSIAEQATYSFGWCKSLLALKASLGDAAENSTPNAAVNETFHRAEAGRNSDHLPDPRLLKLWESARPLTARLEDAANIKLVISYAADTDGTPRPQITRGVAGLNVREAAVYARLDQPLTDAEFTGIRSVRLYTQGDVGFLNVRLKEHFDALPLADDFNMQTGLPAGKLRFIFGPPGTGKTTHLANNEIWRLLETEHQPGQPRRILVLTPTNKAADVLTRKLLARSREAGQAEAPAWLVRYASTADAEVEAANVVRLPRDLDLAALDRCVVISTIARFPYATWGLDAAPLAAEAWDYVILDEASMVGLVPALNVIYQQPHCREFIVGGDPQQIPPIELVDALVDENIYSLVGLRDFGQKTTHINAYPVEPLLTQYRATPPLGNVFSHYAYGGRLRHHRTRESRREVLFGGKPLADLTVIRFPVCAAGEDDIFRPGRLGGGSPYHPYAALLTAKLVQNLAEQFKGRPPAEVPRLGVVAPYRAQAALVREILKQLQLSAELLDPQADVGTVHGFQGDECDIVIVLLNPPRKPGERCFLNRQHLLNVAVSRARDYVIVLAPEEKMDRYASLTEIQRLIRLMYEQGQVPGQKGAWAELLDSGEAEKVLFGESQPNHLRDNTFLANHNDVNVYAQPRFLYELRHSELAVDVQIK